MYSNGVASSSSQGGSSGGGNNGGASPGKKQLTDIRTEAAESSTKSKAEKFCSVCGDRALGYNFNAITCESCKAFFRRNAIKTKEFKCPFQDSCSIDVVTRRFCQKCRLKKCFDIGMKKEWILSDEDKAAKRVKIEENRRKRNSAGVAVAVCDSPSVVGEGSGGSDSAGGAAGGCDSGDSNSSWLVAPPPFVPVMAPVVLGVSGGQVDGQGEGEGEPSCKEARVVAPTQNQILPGPGCSNHNQQQEQVSPVEGAGTSGSFNAIISDMISAGTSDCVPDSPQVPPAPAPQPVIHVQPPLSIPPPLFATSTCSLRELIAQPVVKFEYVELTMEEKEKISELHKADECMTAMPEDWNKIDNPEIVDVINMTDNAVRRMIKMAKKITGFKHMNTDDQIALLKGGTTELMILRSVMSYDFERDCWPVPKNHLQMTVLKKAKDKNVYEAHRQYICSFEDCLRKDSSIMLLLTAIALFDPNRPSIKNKPKIIEEREAYITLLKRYLLTKFDRVTADEYYIHLKERLEALHELHDNHVKVFLDVNPGDVKPLIIELFDLYKR